MEHHSFEFTEKVRKLAGKKGVEVSDTVFENEGKPSVIIKQRIDVACVEVMLTAKKCIVCDENSGDMREFDKSFEGWNEQVLEYLEILLEPFKRKK